MNRRFFIAPLAATLLAVSLFAVACSGDDDDDGGDATATTGSDDTTAEATGTTAEIPTDDDDASPSAEATSDGDDNGDDDGDPLEDLRGALEDQRTARVEYTFEAGGSSGTIIQTQMPGFQKIELADANADGEGTVILIQTADAQYICTETPGEEGACLESPAGSESIFGDIFLFDAGSTLEELVNDDTVDIEEVDGRAIAGYDAKCYIVTEDTGEGEICISEDEGVVVLMDGTFEGEQTKIELVSLSDDVSESDFEPPFPVTSLGN